MLPVELEICLRDRIGIKAAVRTTGCGALRTSRAADTAIDHNLCDVDILWLQLTGHALDQSGQTHLAHGKGRGVCISFDARRSSREQDRSAAGLEHPLRGRLSDEEPAVTSNYNRFANLFGIQFGNWAAHPTASIIDHQIGVADVFANRVK